VRLAAVDIGTNSMRLLIAEDIAGSLVELGRWVRVTGLGRGVDATGRLDPGAVDRTLLALAEFGGRMSKMGVERRRAVATSASRDAANAGDFLDRAELALEVRPEVITGGEEARLSYLGAVSSLPPEEAYVVVDIGGGSTEFVSAQGGRSIDIGSVRLTERALPDRPAGEEELAKARALVTEIFQPVAPSTARLVGVAGTWTSLAGIKRGVFDVHHAELTRSDVAGLVARLAAMTVEQTAALPGFDPARAPVILAGAVLAEGAMDALAAERALISEQDLLDGVVASLAG
jgi:exopolyphosphatase/guanosine-5'-triphosphate,3'-diphosphate pyrophosphatase